MELLTTDQMVEADAHAQSSGIAEFELMQQAAKAISSSATGHCQPNTEILVLSGPANNGGDGYVAARLLQERGFHR